MNKQLLKFLAVVGALVLFQTLFSIAFAKPDLAEATLHVDGFESQDNSQFDSAIPSAASSGYAYVALGYSQLVSVIDLNTYTEVMTINVGIAGCNFPFRPKISPDGAYVYVGCGDSGSVAVVSTASNTVLSNISGVYGIQDLAFTQDGTHVLVPTQWNNQVAILDTTTLTVTDYISTPDYAWNVDTHPYLNIAYVTTGDGSIQIVDTLNFSIIDTIYLGDNPGKIAITPDGHWIFVVDRGGAGLYVVDAITNTVVEQISEFGGLANVEVAPDGSKVYLAGLDTVHVIDTLTFDSIATVPVYSMPWDLETSCDGSEIYVGNESNYDPVINTEIYSVTTQIPVSSYSTKGIAICPQYVASGVFLAPETQINQGAPGQIVTHEATLINSTGSTDSFNLTLGNSNWPVLLSDVIVGPLADGESVTVTLSVTVPIGTDWYLTDTTTITATSVMSPSAYLDTAHMTTQAYAPPQVSVMPDAMSSTQLVNEIMSQTMTITNGFGVTLTFQLLEYDNGVIPGVTPVLGHGEWLYQNMDGIQVQNFQGETRTIFPSAYRWNPDMPSTSLNVLIYANNSSFQAPNTLVDQALQTLGFAYTAHYNGDWIGFETDLNNGNWDLVIVAEDTWVPPTSTLNALNTYVLGDGKLIFHATALLYSPSEPLLSTIGFSYYDSVYPPPPSIEWWDSSNVAFNYPESVPELSAPNDPGYYIYGAYGNALDGFDAIAGFTPDPATNKAALILGNEGHTIFKSFSDATAGADLDADGKIDTVELWVNLIAGIQMGFSGDVPWLSENPITGTVETNTSQIIDVYFDSTNLQPGEYHAQLITVSNDPISPSIAIPVTMTVQPTENMGWVEGYVTDVSTGAPLEAMLIAIGQPYTVTTNSTTGYYKFWLEQGAYTFQVSASGYVSQVLPIDITAQQGISQNFELVLDVPIFQVTPAALSVEQLVGESTTQVFTITNSGPAQLTFEIQKRVGDIAPLASLEPIHISMGGLPEVGDLAKISMPSEIKQSKKLDLNPIQLANESISVLLIGTGDENNPQTWLQGFPDLSPVDTFSALYDTPTLAELIAYDVVLVWSSNCFQDSLALGNVLADYLDAGGSVIVGTFVWIDINSCYEVAGRFTNEGYNPLNSNDYGNHYSYASLGVYDLNHPIMEGVFSAEDLYRDYVNLNSEAYLVASWADGEEFIAVKDQVVALNAYIGDYGWSGDIPTIVHNSILYLQSANVTWLSTNPISGTVSGYSSFPVQASFDATGLQPGTYTADLVIRSNDPQTPYHTTPVTMTVQPSANMGSVAGTLTDAWTGEPITATIQLVGVYTATANPDYTIWADAGTYTLIAYASGYFTETWPVALNAGGQTTLNLALEPFQARLEFAPFPLDATIPEGFTGEYTLVISNTGPAPLLFGLHEVSPTLLSAPASPSDLNGKNILLDLAHGEHEVGYYSTLINAAISEGANVDINSVYPIDASVLEGYDVLWINGGSEYWLFGELNAVMTWLDEGGAVLVQGEANPSTADVAGIYNISYVGGECTYYQSTTNILAHPITTNINELFIEYTCNFLLAPPETEAVVYDPYDQMHGVAHEDNGGKMVVIAATDFTDWNIENSDNLAFGLNVLSWLSAPAYTDVPWFSTSPVSGTVNGHSSMEVTVNIDATNLSVGSNEAILALEHNDPIYASPIQIPVNLTVISSQAGIVLAPVNGEVSGIPGETLVYTLTVTNEGNIPDTFTLQADGVWEPALSITTTPQLTPGETYTFTLSVTIPIDSGDGDTDMITITVQSEFDETVSASAQVTITAHVEEQKIFLPIVYR